MAHLVTTSAPMSGEVKTTVSSQILGVHRLKRKKTLSQSLRHIYRISSDVAALLCTGGSVPTHKSLTNF